jgi:branched-subunit amino acid aminotransferase/4-amino-4-deoxychorismate lyase
MQVRGQAVRGLALHLERLDTATRELYDTGLDGDLVRDRIRHALGDEIADATVRVIVFQPDPGDPPSVLVTVRPPAEAPARPQRLRSVAYQRPLAHIKHTGTFGQIHFGLRAERDGFDDALFTSDDGLVSEAGISNVGGIRSRMIIWPDAPMLRGITMQLLERRLPAVGLEARHEVIPLSGLGSFDAVFLTNSLGVSPAGLVDDRELPAGPEVMAALTELYQSVPWDPI